MTAGLFWFSVGFGIASGIALLIRDEWQQRRDEARLERALDRLIAKAGRRI